MVEMSEDPGAWVKAVIKSYVDSPENTMKNESNERAWAEPLVGFSSGADPLYAFYKEDIGSFYVTPPEWFGVTFPDLDVGPEELTVISWVLPQTQATKAEHRLPRKRPNERWARSRIFGEEFNERLRGHVVETLGEAGVLAVAPMLSPHWKGETSEKYGFASRWSERHAAYAAGLGTFGLCDGLITPKGKAMRTGSVVAMIEIEPTPRSYTDHNAYCLWYAKGTCKECIPRCPAGAITEAGHNKDLCRPYVRSTRKYVEETFGFEGYGCGFCQTGVACESGIPEELLG